MCVAMAMLADAADEGLLLVRANDVEEVDVAATPQQVDHYVQRVKTLFEHGACFTTAVSFTGYALNLLEVVTAPSSQHSLLLWPHRTWVCAPHARKPSKSEAC